MGGATISDKVKIGTKTYAYAEYKSSNRGGGSRGISIWVEGEKGKTTYRKLEPNPHDSRKYNKSQDGFYKQIATDIATYHSQKKAFPPEGFSCEMLEYDGPYKLQECW